MPQRTHTSPATSPTQALRDLIEGNACAMITADELHEALTRLEDAMQLPRTAPLAVLEVAA